MQSAINRLALYQFVTIAYSVLCAAVMVKLRFEGPAPQIFATYLREWGFLLFLLPATWLLWASMQVNHPRPETGELKPVLLSGLGLLGLLLAVAMLGSLSPFLHRSLIKSSDQAGQVLSILSKSGEADAVG